MVIVLPVGDKIKRIIYSPLLTEQHSRRSNKLPEDQLCKSSYLMTKYGTWRSLTLSQETGKDQLSLRSKSSKFLSLTWFSASKVKTRKLFHEALSFLQKLSVFGEIHFLTLVLQAYPSG
ncbi:hypothetical protein CARUB_v10024344mg [Capsella rubella]|uniref:Uncharacterized protein n=1 Tax=Capsella rubella TaxID=81985 RepID=R0HEV2_9BRAS|nr:hypothetical protein CARUB_v10024344mg [Capsella rubella]